MARYAVILNGIVDNIIEADTPLPGTTLAHDWTRIGDVLVGDRLPSEPSVPPLPLAEVHVATVHTINTAFESAIAPFMAVEPPSAVATYSEQRMEAEAYTADNTAPTPLLDCLAAARGIEKADLARRVLEKYALSKQASGLLLGQQQALMDNIQTIMSDTRLSDAEKVTTLAHLDTTVALPAQFTEVCLAAIRESMSAAAAGSAQKPTLFAKLKQVFSNKE